MSAKKPPLKVVLCWHMHQPQYLDRESDRYELPWTYLHAVKDYEDMAVLLEEAPKKARAVVNFAPILLEQIADYAEQVNGYLAHSRPLRDPILAALVNPAPPMENGQRRSLIRAGLRANRERLIDRFPQYSLLADLAACIEANSGAIRYFNQQYVIDLMVWFHLAWIGETVRRRDERVQRLMDKAEGFSQHDRRQLLEVIGEVLSGVLDRYARLAQSGKVELAMSPYGHPIVPLMLDLASARESEPHAKMPVLERYPGGRERVDWHLQEGLRVFQEHLGVRPAGCWPSEGGISTATAETLGGHGFRWAASGGSVLRNSLGRNELELECIHRPYRVNDCDVACFFRDDGLSDLIGFEYSGWHAEDAVANLIHHLENIEGACKGEANRVVPIILDGENAWEFYPENGYYFLTELYKRLSEHSGLELTTFAECLDAGLEPTVLEEGIVAGSWVYGTFSTWIGDRDKNRGWDLLGEAKRCFDEVIAEGRLTDDDRAAAERQLAICEGSDWFWWFGDYNPSESVRDFDRLYRLHLANLYRLLGEEPPDELSQVISHGGGHPARGGTMRPGQEPR